MTVSSKMNISDELNYGRHGVVRLLSFFASQQEEIKYVPNPGNAGDALIALTTILSFKKLGLNFHYMVLKLFSVIMIRWFMVGVAILSPCIKMPQAV